MRTRQLANLIDHTRNNPILTMMEVLQSYQDERNRDVFDVADTLREQEPDTRNTITKGMA